MIVIDASALIDSFLGDPHIAAAIRGQELHAPVTVDAEVIHALRRALIRGVVVLAEVESAIDLLLGTYIVRHPIQPVVRRMWALRHNIAAYDAGYVALAESLNVPLITRDRRLSQSSGHAARIEYID
ncbi:MAG TPA: type II toxin-antitoxin system VapC family toxin [Thermoanaerobaculia bacterium]|nr:type II toxin-antitoxin system VapC family toxin [Thermoanaerobaculia bacterium]